VPPNAKSTADGNIWALPPRALEWRSIVCQRDAGIHVRPTRRLSAIDRSGLHNPAAVIVGNSSELPRLPLEPRHNPSPHGGQRFHDRVSAPSRLAVVAVKAAAAIGGRLFVWRAIVPAQTAA
jgi:hypothetical protein